MAVLGHSRLGASSCKRWMNCPGSVSLIESLNLPNKETIYAAEGTVAHEICENYLRYGLPEISISENGLLGECREQGDFEIKITEEMLEACYSYATTILEDMVNAGLILEASTKKHPIDATKLYIEQQFDLSSISPELGGTNDASVWNDKSGKLTVYDFKYGKGVPVEVEDNEQLMFYALGVIEKRKITPSTIELCIIQPRCFHEDGPIRRWELSIGELMKFRASLKEGVANVKTKSGEFSSGSYCRWCPAKAVCPKVREQVNEGCQMDFAPIGLPKANPVLEPPKVQDLTVDQISNIMKLIPVVEGFIEEVKSRSTELLNQGINVPGFKLVLKRQTRKWIDENEVEAAFGDKAVEKKVKSPAQLEKIVGKEAIKDYVVLSEAGTTVVPESDKRQAVIPVQQAFDCVEIAMDI